MPSTEVVSTTSTTFDASSGRLYSVTIGAVVIGSILGSIIFGVMIMACCKKHKRSKYSPHLKPNPKFKVDPQKTLFDQANELPYTLQWEFPRKFLSFTKMLGSGAFGQQIWMAEAFEIGGFHPRVNGRISSKPKRRSGGVTVKYKGHCDTVGYKLEDRTVAVKTLKEDSTQSDYMDLACELKILIQVGEHPNIVNLLGASTKGGNLNVILEHCPNGTLVNYLRERREIFIPEWEDKPEKMSFIHLMTIVQQILKGMYYLKSKQVHHLNLSAHNILVAADSTMKISDFGRPRDLSKDSVFLILTQGSDRNVSSNLPLSVKWMSPENVLNRTDTDMNSDVWAFGVVLWEVFSLGEDPYPGVTNEEMVMFIQHERRMTSPKGCPKDIYGLMVDCWQTVSCKRPTFQEMNARVDGILRQNAPSYGEKVMEVEGKSERTENPGDSVINLPVSNLERCKT